jgi:hypothetical protein
MAEPSRSVIEEARALARGHDPRSFTRPVAALVRMGRAKKQREEILAAARAAG